MTSWLFDHGPLNQVQQSLIIEWFAEITCCAGILGLMTCLRGMTNLNELLEQAKPVIRYIGRDRYGIIFIDSKNILYIISNYEKYH